MACFQPSHRASPCRLADHRISGDHS